MGGLVERQIAEAMEALVDRDSPHAREVITRDEEVNHMDVANDEQCIRLLALHQPTASDLRFITTGLKITTDLERIGDNAVNICERALELNEVPQLKPYVDLPRMSELAEAMVRDSLNALVRGDVELAESVLQRDDQVDRLRDQLFRELLTYMMENSAVVFPSFELILVAKNLERIGDHATNIAEDVIYLIDGEIVRHRPTSGG